jgi:hypothetical protein
VWIDPGLAGGLAIRTKSWVIAEAMPVNDDGLDIPELVRWIKFNREHFDVVFLERVQPMPFNGSIGSFKLGQGFGSLLAVMRFLEVPCELVQPRKWSQAFPHEVVITERNKREKAIKVARREIVQRLFPTVDLRASERSTTSHEGMIDALLIAEYGYQLRKGNA